MYAKVDAVLAKAPGIVEELKSYQGAGVAIREVSQYITPNKFCPYCLGNSVKDRE